MKKLGIHLKTLSFPTLDRTITFLNYKDYLFQDNNGTIENEELRGFLKDLLELVKKVTNKLFLHVPLNIAKCRHKYINLLYHFQDYDAQDLLDFEETILRGVDYNQDGKINRKELTMILLAIAKHNQEEEPNQA